MHPHCRAKEKEKWFNLKIASSPLPKKWRKIKLSPSMYSVSDLVLSSHMRARGHAGVSWLKKTTFLVKNAPPPLRAQVFHSKLTEAVSSWLMHEFVFTAAQRGSDAATYWVSYGDTANHSSGLSCSGLSCSAAIPRPTTGGDAATSRCRGSPTWLWVATKAINIKCWVRHPIAVLV